jgi:hypothetical protein
MRRCQRLDEVATWQQRALEGKEIRKQIFQLPNVRTAPQILLLRIARYMRDCGDHEIADQLLRELASVREGDEWGASPPEDRTNRNEPGGIQHSSGPNTPLNSATGHDTPERK